MEQKNPFYTYLAVMAAVFSVFLLLATPLVAHAVATADCPDGTTVTQPPTSTYNQVCATHMKSDTSAPPVTTTTPASSDQLADPAAECTKDNCDIFEKYLNPTINLLSALVGVAVVASIIIGGIQYTASAGDPQKAAKAKSHIYNAVLALLAFIFLFTFVQWIIPGGLLNKS